MSKSLNWWTRKIHRWGAIICLLPLILVIISGLMLQLKKDIAWIQPTTMEGTPELPKIEWNAILDLARSDEQAEIEDWSDVDRIDVQPSIGLIKLRAKNRWELQIDWATGEVLASEYRRSDLIESLHDGSFFGQTAKLWIFLPSGAVLLLLWLSGLYLWYLPYHARRKRRLRTSGVAAKKHSSSKDYARRDMNE
jgi:hypothetical protein